MGLTETEMGNGAGAGGASATTPLEDWLGVATVVALTVTFWVDIIDAGAEYIPVADSVPTFGLRDHVTD